nr:unnamed protein product [Digitaria exilis]
MAATMDAFRIITLGIPCSWAAAGAQWLSVSAITQSGRSLLGPSPAQAAARNSANGTALDARERERNEVDHASGMAPEWREAREVARRGDEGHVVAT